MTTILKGAFQVKPKSYPEHIRAALHRSINKVAADPNACAKNPERDFSRKRKLPLRTMLLMLVGIGGGSLAKELYDWFDYSTNTASSSAFVQQRDKICPEALEMIFKDLVSTTTPTATFQGYRLLAIDGSDLRLPSNPSDEFSLIRNSAGQKQYNLVHLNAMYDLANKVYVDVAMQGKKE